MLLLKSEGRSSRDISRVTGTAEASVNNWVNRFESEGMAWLSTKAAVGVSRSCVRGTGLK